MFFRFFSYFSLKDLLSFRLGFEQSFRYDVFKFSRRFGKRFKAFGATPRTPWVQKSAFAPATATEHSATHTAVFAQTTYKSYYNGQAVAIIRKLV